MKQDLKDWQFDTKLILQLIKIHDSEFRRKYVGKRTNEIIYSDGRWFCDEMVESRKKIKEVKKIVEKGFLESPFIGNIKFTENFLKPVLRYYPKGAYNKDLTENQK